MSKIDIKLEDIVCLYCEDRGSFEPVYKGCTCCNKGPYVYQYTCRDCGIRSPLASAYRKDEALSLAYNELLRFLKKFKDV